MEANEEGLNLISKGNRKVMSLTLGKQTIPGYCCERELGRSQEMILQTACLLNQNPEEKGKGLSEDHSSSTKHVFTHSNVTAVDVSEPIGKKHCKIKTKRLVNADLFPLKSSYTNKGQFLNSLASTKANALQ